MQEGGKGWGGGGGEREGPGEEGGGGVVGGRVGWDIFDADPGYQTAQ